MKQQKDSMSELRAAFTMRELEKAQRTLQTGATGVFIRVALAIIFMYLIFMSYEILGVTGPVFVSVLFLIALLAPFFYHILKGMTGKLRAQSEGNVVEKESLQES